MNRRSDTKTASTVLLTFRCTEAEREKWARAAKRAGVTLSEYIRALLAAQVKR